MKNKYFYDNRFIHVVVFLLSISLIACSEKSNENETINLNTVEGLRKLIRSTKWSFSGFERIITYEFQTDSTFIRNVNFPKDGIMGTQYGTYKILPAKYSRTNKSFLYIKMSGKEKVLSSGAIFPCDTQYFLIPDSDKRLYDPTLESSFWCWNEKETSFKAVDEDGSEVKISIEENKDINGYKLTNGVLLYPKVLDFFPVNNN